MVSVGAIRFLARQEARVSVGAHGDRLGAINAKKFFRSRSLFQDLLLYFLASKVYLEN
ncbi:MAG: hypothetical protein F6J93_27440 [Oscillatoria sp. SIO1A7]|nr:hypothetical protein [Oscillatoria sp. SIO1A7]